MDARPKLDALKALLEEARQSGVSLGRMVRVCLSLGREVAVRAAIDTSSWLHPLLSWSLHLAQLASPEQRQRRLTFSGSLAETRRRVEADVAPEPAFNQAYLRAMRQSHVAVWSAIEALCIELEAGGEGRFDKVFAVIVEAVDALSERRIRPGFSMLSEEQQREYFDSLNAQAEAKVRGILLAHLPDPWGDFDWGLLAEQRLTRVRARPEALRAEVAGVTGAQEAWEVLTARGRLPLAWEGATRRFHGTTATPWGPRRVTDAVLPSSVDEVLKVAASVERIDQAERLALTFGAAIAPWEPGRAQGVQVAWALGKPTAPAASTGPWPLALSGLLMKQLERVKEPAVVSCRVAEPAQWSMASTASYAYELRARCEQWRVLTASHARVMAHPKIPEALEGQHFRAFENPFAPLVSLDQLGCCLDDNRDGVLVLRLAL